MDEGLDTILYLRQRSDELPVLLANSQAGGLGRLYNPTAIANGWAPLLAQPNPTTRDELLHFTSKCQCLMPHMPVNDFLLMTVNQCIASAANLGLPLLPAQTPVLDRRRQIAVKIGVPPPQG